MHRQKPNKIQKPNPNPNPNPRCPPHQVAPPPAAPRWPPHQLAPGGAGVVGAGDEVLAEGLVHVLVDLLVPLFQHTAVLGLHVAGEPLECHGPAGAGWGEGRVNGVDVSSSSVRGTAPTGKVMDRGGPRTTGPQM